MTKQGWEALALSIGFVVARFGLFLHELAAGQHTPPKPAEGLSLWIGGSLVVLGVITNVLAAFQHVRLLRRLSGGETYHPVIWSLGVIATLLLAILGVVMTAYLFVGSS